MIGLNIVLVLVLLLASAFFSASETAFTSVNTLRLRRAAESGDRLSRRAQWVYERYDAAISAILVGNILVNNAASAIAASVCISLMGPSGAGVASVLMTFLLLFVGEISPKIIAKQLSDQLVRYTSEPLRAIMLALTPFGKAVTLLVDKLAAGLLPEKDDEPTITEEEFHAILDTVEDEGVMDEERAELLNSALSFDDAKVYQIMRPRVDIVALDIEDEQPELLKEIFDSGYSRIPVYEDTIDNIIGVLHVNRYLEKVLDEGVPDIRAMLLPPLKIHKTMALDDVLRLLQKQRIHIAIVIDEYGGTLGLVTLEDLLEQLVGEIWDEGDDIVEECREVEENVYECSGDMNIEEFFDYIDFMSHDFECEYDTLGGWAIEMLDAMPAEGKSFDYEHLRVTVAKMDDMRVETLRIEVGEEDGEER